MAILLALSSALVYGVADWCGGRASRFHPSAVVTLVGQAVSFVLIAIAVAVVGTPIPPPATFAWGLGGRRGRSDRLGVPVLRVRQRRDDRGRPDQRGRRCRPAGRRGAGHGRAAPDDRVLRHRCGDRRRRAGQRGDRPARAADTPTDHRLRVGRRHGVRGAVRRTRQDRPRTRGCGRWLPLARRRSLCWSRSCC